MGTVIRPALAVLLMLTMGVVALSASSGPALGADARDARAVLRRLPPIARILGIRVGIDYIADLERQLGPGKAITGADPDSARLWRIRPSGWVVYADECDGVVDVVRVMRPDVCGTPVSAIPWAKSTAPSLRFAAGLQPGWPRLAALCRAAKVFSKPHGTRDGYEWTRSGYVYHNFWTTFRSWTIALGSIGDKLSEYTVDCEDVIEDRKLAEACRLNARNYPDEQFDKVKAALHAGADPNVSDQYGFTALMSAASWGHKRNVLLLLQHGASARRVDSEGNTALIYACSRDYLDEEAIVAALLRHGALVSHRNHEGKSAMDYAREQLMEALRTTRRNVRHGRPPDPDLRHFRAIVWLLKAHSTRRKR